MNPKISDFGLARSFEGNQTQANTHRIVGTYFGVLVLEIVSGMKNSGFNHPEHDNNLTGHAWTLYNEDRSMELIDASLAKSCHPHEVLRSIEVGLLCVQEDAGDRPNMSSVVRMLDCEGALPHPKQPAFFMGRGILVPDFSLSNNPAGSNNGLSITHLDAR